MSTSTNCCCCCQITSVMSDSVWPHRWQPTRLPRPWDSPGKNTGVGCHFLLQCMKVKSLSRVRLLATPWTAAYQAPPSMGFSRQEYWSGVPLPSLHLPTRASLFTQTVTNLTAMQETWMQYLGWKILWRKELLSTPVLLPGEFQGQRSLVSYGPQCCKESDTTEQLIILLSSTRHNTSY